MSTEKELLPDEEIHPQEIETPKESPESQTETNLETDAAEGTDNSSDSQTESEIEAPKKRTPRRRSKARPEAENSSQSGVEEKVKENGSEDIAADAAKPRRKRPYTRPSLSVLSIDNRLGVETELEKARNDLLDLMESLKSQRILTGTIQGVERPTDNPDRSLAVLYHGAFKVIIPAEEAVEPPEDLRGRPLDEVMHYTLTKRLGAETDYIVKGMDAKAGIAVGSRLEAMRIKRREYYFGTDRDGNNLLYEGICAEARVVSAIRAGIFVDLFGLEVYIPLRELSYQRLLDASTKFQPGDRVIVKILAIDRSDRSHIRVMASVKQAEENPYEKALRKYSVGNRYVGTVSVVDTNGVFVALDGGIDCLCSYPRRGRPPRGARVTVRILGINHESNRIWGAITHISAPK